INQRNSSAAEPAPSPHHAQNRRAMGAPNSRQPASGQRYTWVRIEKLMPIISAFFGIIIRMFYNEHDPPHFHAEHQGQLAVFSFDGEIARGRIRSRTARELKKNGSITSTRVG